MSEPMIAIEALSLLLQVAWADDQVDPREAEGLRSFGRHIGLSVPEQAALSDHLAGTRRLPPPDLGRLRDHRDEVLRLARELVALDGAIGHGERDVMAQIEAILALGGR